MCASCCGGQLKYGQNLVELARLLAEAAPLTAMDIGANVATRH